MALDSIQPSNRAASRQALRKRFLRMLRKAYRDEKLSLSGDYFRLNFAAQFEAWLAPLAEKTWIVHSEVANQGGSRATMADAERTIRYLARYASGVALHNSRLRAINDKTATFSYKDYRDNGRWKKKTLDGVEFLRRFLLPAALTVRAGSGKTASEHDSSLS